MRWLQSYFLWKGSFLSCQSFYCFYFQLKPESFSLIAFSKVVKVIWFASNSLSVSESYHCPFRLLYMRPQSMILPKLQGENIEFSFYFPFLIFIVSLINLLVQHCLSDFSPLLSSFRYFICSSVPLWFAPFSLCFFLCWS